MPPTRPIPREAGQGPRVALAGPCGSGKSTIAHRLRALGVDARMPTQEHSGVPTMWQKLLAPDLLVMLDARNEVLRARRPGINLSDGVLAQQRHRLRDAIRHAQLQFDTGQQSVEEIEAAILAWLDR